MLKGKINLTIYTLSWFMTLVFVVGLYGLNFYKFPIDPQVLEYHVRILNLESSRGQVLLYEGLLGLVFVICALILLFPGRRFLLYRPHSSTAFFVTFLFAAYFLSIWSKVFFVGASFVLFMVLASKSNLPNQLISFVKNVLGTNIGGLIKRFTPSTFVFLSMTVIALLMVTPLFTPLSVSTPNLFAWIEGHYSGSILPGVELFNSEEGKLFSAHYGYCLPLITLITLKLFSLVGHSTNDLVAVVKIGQVLGVILIYLVIFIINKKYAPYIFSLAFGLTAFTLSNVGMAVSFPNQSVIRYIPLLVTLAVFSFEANRNKFRVHILAPICALGVVMNPETGIAATLGVLVAVALHGYKLASPLSSVFSATIKFVLFFVPALSLLYSLITSLFHLSGVSGLFDFINLFHGSNYGGMVDKPSLTASLIFFIAISTLFRSCWLTVNNQISSTVKCEAALSTISLIWLIYYVNRMAEWNLWFQFILIVFLIAPRISNGYFNSLLTCKFGLRFIVLAVLIVGQLGASAMQILPLTRAWIATFQSECTSQYYIDGMCLPMRFGSNISMQLNALSGYSESTTIVLSAMPSAVRLRGFNAKFPWAYGMPVIFKNDVNKYINLINQSPATFILIDDPNTELAKGVPEKNEYLLDFVPLLTSYRVVGRRFGWLVLKKRL